MALNNRTIRAALKAGQHVEIPDTVVTGLHVVVTAGGAATFAVRYRVAGGRRRLRLGRYGTLTVDAARVLARRALAEVDKHRLGLGADPAAAGAVERKALRMVDLFGPSKDKDGKPGEGWYLDTYVKTAGKLHTAKSDKGIANDHYAIAKHLRSRKGLMRKRVDAVTVADLQAIKADIGDRNSAWRKVRNMLQVAFKHAMEIGEIKRDANPVERTVAKTDGARARYLAPDERQRLELVLRRAEKIGPDLQGVARGGEGGLSPHLVRVFRLLVLTGMRRGDVLALRWEWADLDRGVLRLPTSKTGARDVPLTPHAVDYLRAELERAGGKHTVGLVCCTKPGGPIHPENVTRAWRTVRRAAGLDGADGRDAVRLHDLRHSWASDAVSAGVPLYLVQKVLGHKHPTTTARYAHAHDDALSNALAIAGDAIERHTRGEGNVIALPVRERPKATSKSRARKTKTRK